MNSIPATHLLFILLDTTEHPYPIWTILISMAAGIGIIVLAWFLLGKDNDNRN